MNITRRTKSNSNRDNKRNTKRYVFAGTVALATLLGAGTAAARCRPTIDLHGRGAAVDEGWRYATSGDLQGRPFRGSWTAGLYVNGGVFPAAGECVDGDASLFLDGPRRTEISVVSLGEVCAPYDDGTSQVAYSYVGQFDTYDSSPRRFDDTQGWIEIVIADDGSVNLTMISN